MGERYASIVCMRDNRISVPVSSHFKFHRPREGKGIPEKIQEKSQLKPFAEGIKSARLCECEQRKRR